MKTNSTPIDRFDEKYNVKKDDDLITATRYSLLFFLESETSRVNREWREKIEGMKKTTWLPNWDKEDTCVKGEHLGFNKALSDLLTKGEGGNHE